MPRQRGRGAGREPWSPVLGEGRSLRGSGAGQVPAAVTAAVGPTEELRMELHSPHSVKGGGKSGRALGRGAGVPGSPYKALPTPADSKSNSRCLFANPMKTASPAGSLPVR